MECPETRMQLNVLPPVSVSVAGADGMPAIQSTGSTTGTTLPQYGGQTAQNPDGQTFFVPGKRGDVSRNKIPRIPYTLRQRF